MDTSAKRFEKFKSKKQMDEAIEREYPAARNIFNLKGKCSKCGGKGFLFDGACGMKDCDCVKYD